MSSPPLWQRVLPVYRTLQEAGGHISDLTGEDWATLALHQKHCAIHEILRKRSLWNIPRGMDEVRFFPGLHARLGSLTEFWSFRFLISSALQRSTSAFHWVHSQTASSLNSQSLCCEYSDFMRGNKIPRMHFFMQLSLKNTLLYLPLEALAQTAQLTGPFFQALRNGFYKRYCHTSGFWGRG